MGPVYALACGLMWSIAVVMFKRYGRDANPLALNFFKNTIGLLAMLPTVFIFDGALWFVLEWEPLLTVLLSGVIGIGFADAVFFQGLRYLGASKMAIVECAYSPFVLLLSMVFFQESLLIHQYVGGALVVGAILSLSLARRSRPNPEENLPLGILCGVLAVFSMASGILMIKPVFAIAPLLWIIMLRLLSGTIASGALLLIQKNGLQHWQQLMQTKHRLQVFIASFIAAYISMMLWVASYKYAQATIAAVLNQMTTIFTIVLAALFLRERLTPTKIAAAIAAAIGAILVAH